MPKEMNLASLARSFGDMAIRKVAFLAQFAKSEMVQLAAATVILDRGWGKPAQSHTGQDGEGPIIVEIVVRPREPREPMKVIEGTPINGTPAAPS